MNGRIDVVIGANYGDEGKGHVTDRLAGPDTLVVRFNGGAQAGHTVVTPEGERHVFHQLGSGTLRGAPTYLSRYFLVNPMVFASELKSVRAFMPSVIVDPLALVTVPFDMMINQAAEAKRGKDRHGSCGLGINETMERSEVMPIPWGQVRSSTIPAMLADVRRWWVPGRLRELGLVEADLPYLDHPGIVTAWQADVEFMKLHTQTMSWGDAVELKENLLFEGAQGLGLDERAPGFPHLTRSRTGLSNVARMLTVHADFSRSNVGVHYVTRPYVTRHGAGPLEHELPDKPFGLVEDATNVPNVHQGTLRFAHLDVDETCKRISHDLSRGRASRLMLEPRLHMTCVDQVPLVFPAYHLFSKREFTPRELCSAIVGGVGFDAYTMYTGPTRKDVL